MSEIAAHSEVPAANPPKQGEAGPPRDPAAALAAMLARATADTHVSGEFHSFGPGRTLPEEQEGILLWIGREALTNALRHGRPTRIVVELTFSGHHVKLWVQDNGQGFDALAAAPHRFGLVGMRERTERAGGHLAIRSQPGHGTEIVLIMPDAISARLSGRLMENEHA